MTPVNGYSTLAEIKALKEINSTDTARDAIIEEMIEAASRFIDNRCGRVFYLSTADETRTFTAAADDYCFVDDLVSVTTLKTDEDGDRTYEITWASTDYDLLPENAAAKGWPYTYIELAPLGRYDFPEQRKGVQIVGKFGFPSVPEPVSIACRAIVLGLYQNRFGGNPQGQVTVTGAGVVINPKSIPADVLALVDPYMRLS